MARNSRETGSDLYVCYKSEMSFRPNQRNFYRLHI
jgi:hypothetical protein